MQSGAFADIFHRQLSAALDAVDTFMLRAVIHIYAPDILHRRNSCYICNENHDTQHAFHNRQQRLIQHIVGKQHAQKIRQHDKNCNCHQNRQRNRSADCNAFCRAGFFLFRIRRIRFPIHVFCDCIRNHFLLLRLFGLFLLVGYILLRLVFFKKLRRPGQCAHAKHQRVYKIKYTA